MTLTNDEVRAILAPALARCPFYKERWTKIYMDDGDADVALAAEALPPIYRRLGLEPPKEILVADGPIAQQELANERMGAPPGDRVMRDICLGEDDATWLSWYDWVREEICLKGLMTPDVATALGFPAQAPPTGWEHLLDDFVPLFQMARATGWWLAFPELVILSHKRKVLRMDDAGELHCADGPALAFRDGVEIYLWHGVEVSKKTIMAPETITIQEIRAENNTEVRRIMRERFGEDRYLAAIGAKVIDTDMSPVHVRLKGSRAIMRALLEDDEKRRYLVGTDGSTGRTYYMEVPGTVATCRAAHEFLAGGKTEDKLIAQS